MIVLGLGSNIGDRVGHLRRAIRRLAGGSDPLLREMRVSPLYESRALIPHGAPASFDHDFLNCAVAGTTRLDVVNLFNKVKEIERALGRTHSEPWAPRIIDIDILAAGDQIFSDEALTVPHRELHARPFALNPLTDMFPDWVHPVLKKPARELAATWGAHPPLQTRRASLTASQVVGIINATPDSFSDGSVFNEPVGMAARARRMIAAGATVIDVGAESTRPGATLLSPDDEWQRIEPFLRQLKRDIPELGNTINFSIDTRHGAVAEKAFGYGVNWVNDVSGLEETRMRDVIKSADCRVVVMHNLGIPPSPGRCLPPNQDATETLVQWGLEKLEALSPFVGPERIVLDPGIGFGKSRSQILEILKNARQFRRWPCPVLVGHSRKSFLGDDVDRDGETAILSAALAEAGIEFIRVHDVPLNLQSLEFSARHRGVFL